MPTAISLLRHQTNEAFDLVQRAMTDVDDKMLHWEPMRNSWGLRFKDGRWIPDYDEPQPIPPGPKTIGWLAAHLAACKEMYFEYAFGLGQKTWEELALPGDAVGLRQYLSRTQKSLVDKLGELDDSDLERPVLTNWGEKKPIWWVYWVMIYHDVEHGGQIMQVKNEYNNRE